MFSIAIHRGKNLLEYRTNPLQWSAVMSSHAAFMASNRDIWSCGLWPYTFHIYAKKTLLLDLGMESMVEGTPLLSFRVQQTSP